MRRIGWVGVMVLGVAAASSYAAPEDEFKRGLQAYQTGDVTGAMRILRPNAQAGHAPSMALLGFILDRADFVDEALALYRQAVEKNDPEGHAAMAGFYQAGRGIAKDEKRAFEHFSKAADLGHALSVEIVAQIAAAGRIGPTALELPDAKVREWVLRAAERGHLASIDALSQGYQQGRWGLPVDAASAARWQARGAELRKQRAAVGAASAAKPTR